VGFGNTSSTSGKNLDMISFPRVSSIASPLTDDSGDPFILAQKPPLKQ